MKLLLKIITVFLVTTNCATKSFGDSNGLPEKSRNKLDPQICFSRPEIEEYKNDCDLTKLKLKDRDDALQASLYDPHAVEFFQTKPFVAGLGVVAFLLGFLAGRK